MNPLFQGHIQGHEILFRYPEPEDLNEALRYVNALSIERTFLNFQGEEISRDFEEKYLTNLLHKIENKTAVALFAFSENILIGAADIEMRGQNRKHVGEFGISVAKEFRGIGIGRLLMEHVLREVKDNLPQLKILTLVVYQPNEIAKDMYKKFGFVEYGILPEGVIFQDHPTDEILMYKRIENET